MRIYAEFDSYIAREARHEEARHEEARLLTTIAWAVETQGGFLIVAVATEEGARIATPFANFAIKSTILWQGTANTKSSAVGSPVHPWVGST